MSYPSSLDTFDTTAQGTSLLSAPDHALSHRTLGSAVGTIERVLGTTAGTSVLKNFSAGDFPEKTGKLSFGTNIVNLGTSAPTSGQSLIATSGTTALWSGGAGNIYVTIGSVNADYITDGTDDNIQLQQAIDDVSAIGGAIFVKGTLNCFTNSNGTNIIHAKSNVTLLGEGKASEIKNLQPGTQSNGTRTYTDAGFIDGEDIVNFKIKDLYVNGNTTINIGVDPHGAGWTIFFYTKTAPNTSLKNIELDNVYVWGNDFAGIGFEGGLDVKVNNCHVEKCPDAGIAFIRGTEGYECKNNWIETSIFGISTSSQGASSGELSTFGYTRKGVVKDNYISNTVTNGYGIEIDGTTDTVFDSNMIVMGNGALSGIAVVGNATDAAYNVDRIVIKNSLINISGTNPLAGMNFSLQPTGRMLVEDNIITAGSVVTAQWGINAIKSSPKFVRNIIEKTNIGVEIDSSNTVMDYVFQSNIINYCNTNIVATGTYTGNKSRIVFNQNSTGGAVSADSSIASGYIPLDQELEARVIGTISALGTLQRQIAVHIGGVLYYIPLYTTGS